MNCKEAHRLIAGLNGETLPEGLAAHIETCRDCAARLAVDARLRTTLRSPSPTATPYVLGRIRQEIAAPPRRSWTEALKLGNPMKITLSAAALVALALVSLPRAADAATPLATFAKMKKAVLARARSVTRLELHVGKVADGSIGSWVVLDGELTQLGPNGTFHSNRDGKNITVKSSVQTHGLGSLPDGSPDLSSLPPEQREQVRKAIQDALNGKGGVDVAKKYIVNGKEVDEATAQGLLHGAGLDVSLSIDLDEGDYRSIAFGADRDHLVLLPKKTKDRRTVVALDPKTSLPLSVADQRRVGGAWKTARTKAVRLG